MSNFSLFGVFLLVVSLCFSFSKTTWDTQVDISIQNVQGWPNYQVIPLRHVQPMAFFVEVTNFGSLPATNLVINAAIDLDGDPQTFVSSSAIPSLQGGTTTTPFFGTNYTPNAIGDYNIQFIPTMNELDANPSNDVLNRPFTVSNSTYSRNDGVVTDDIGIGFGVSGFIGQDFELIQNDILTSINFTVTSANLGETYRAVLFNQLFGEPENAIAVSETIVVTNPTILNYTLNFADNGIPLLPGTYTIALEEPFTETLDLGFSPMNFEPNTTWATLGQQWSALEGFGIEGSLVLSAEFNCPNPVVDFSVNQQDDLTFVFNDQSTAFPQATYLWDFGDGATSNSSDVLHTFPNAGTYTVCLTVTDFCNAVTTCRAVDVTGSVSIEEQTIGQRFQVFPNPAYDQVRLEWTSIQEDFRVDLVNPLGQTVQSQFVGAGDSGLNLDLNGLSPGVYLVQFVLNEAVVSKKLLIQ
ncbi:MAG: PKD domain-containing protein [Bacteroidota bacterium]